VNFDPVVVDCPLNVTLWLAGEALSVMTRLAELFPAAAGSKEIDNEHEAPEATVVPVHVPVAAKSVAWAPVTFTELTTSPDVPVLESVTVCAGEDVPKVCDPKERAVALRAATAVSPPGVPPATVATLTDAFWSRQDVMAPPILFWSPLYTACHLYVPVAVGVYADET
jgi:hypothetical protein